MMARNLMRHRTGIALITTSVVLMTISTIGVGTVGATQVEDVSGRYVGRIALSGVVGINTLSLGTSTDSYAYWDYNFSGPLDLAITNGAMDGEYTLGGPANLQIQNAQAGLILSRIVSNFNVEATGSLIGPPGASLLNGDFNWTGTTTRELYGLGATTFEEPPELVQHSVPLTEVIITCNLVTGRWDARFIEAFTSAGLEAFLYGYFTARAVSSTDDTDDVRSNVEGLTDRINEWAGKAQEVTPDGQLLYLLDAHDLLDLAQRLAAQPAVSGQCVDPCDFITPLAMAADAGLRTLVAKMPGSTNSSMASLALGSGALSRCASAVLKGLRDVLRSDLEVRIDNLLADGAQNDPIWELELLDVARTAQMLGVEKLGPGGISPGEVFTLLGASS
jgi:hypothetical protein